jgi:hypothetical protein
MHRNKPFGGTAAFDWRRSRGLIGTQDRMRLYSAPRHPRGDYPVPLPADLVPSVVLFPGVFR